MLNLGATFAVLGRQASGEGRGRDGDHGGLMSSSKAEIPGWRVHEMQYCTRLRSRAQQERQESEKSRRKKRVSRARRSKSTRRAQQEGGREGWEIEDPDVPAV